MDDDNELFLASEECHCALRATGAYSKLVLTKGSTPGELPVPSLRAVELAFTGHGCSPIVGNPMQSAAHR